MKRQDFTEEELHLLSNGLIALIQNATEAEKLVWDHASQAAIEDYVKKLQKLNSKVCYTDRR